MPRLPRSAQGPSIARCEDRVDARWREDVPSEASALRLELPLVLRQPVVADGCDVDTARVPQSASQDDQDQQRCGTCSEDKLSV